MKTLVMIGALLIAGACWTPAMAEDIGDRVDHRLDRRGDRIDRRADRRGR